MNQLFYDSIKSIIGDKYDIIDEEKQLAICSLVRDLQEKSQAEYNECKNSNPRPERYGSFYAKCIFGSSDVVVIIQWSHINSQHPMSPDGMAMIQRESLVHISSIPE